MSAKPNKAAARKDFSTSQQDIEADKYKVPRARFVPTALALAELIGVDRSMPGKWVNAQGLRAAKTLDLSKGKVSLGFDMKDAWDWNYQQGVAAGQAAAGKKSDKALGSPTKTYTDPETGEKFEISGPEVAEAVKRTILAKADKMEEEAAKARIAREQESRELSYNADIRAIVGYIMRQTAASHVAAEDSFVKMMVERGVHPDDARGEVRARFRQMVSILDRGAANPFKDPLASERSDSKATGKKKRGDPDADVVA